MPEIQLIYITKSYLSLHNVSMSDVIMLFNVHFSY